MHGLRASSTEAPPFPLRYTWGMDSASHRSFDLPDYGDRIGAAFFDRSPEVVAPELLGALLVSTVGGVDTGGIIVEVEAYLGSHDAGSHAATRGITKRNAVMYGPPGSAYVYFTYGNHHMLNLVCEPEGVAGAVLVRALEPAIGIEVMSGRRRGLPLGGLCSGPGKLAAALGLAPTDTGSRLGDGRLSVYHGEPPAPSQVARSGRIGLSSGHELELRWYVDGSAFVSRGKTGPLVRGIRRSKEEGAE
jgi:DNA-3-methyladenine glycosylase